MLFQESQQGVHNPSKNCFCTTDLYKQLFTIVLSETPDAHVVKLHNNKTH